MKKILIMLLFIMISFVSTGLAQDVLPFDVKMAGQNAEVKDKISVFAVIENPVTNDAELEVAGDHEIIFINVFPSDKNGAAILGTQPSVIVIQGSNTTKLDQTMDKKALSPGTYVMNIVASGQTARVLFQVK